MKSFTIILLMVHLYLARIMHDFNNIWDLDSLGAAKITQVNLSTIL